MKGKQFAAALAELEYSAEAFAERCGIHRTTVYRWIRTNTVPKWAAWLAQLLQERRVIGEHLSEPAQ